MSGDNGVLDGAAILAMDDLPREPVRVSEWNDRTVYLRRMGSDEAEDYWYAEKKLGDDSDEHVKGASARLLVRVLCDARGVLLFSPDQVDALRKKNPAALLRLSAVAARINGFGDVEETAKNSEATPGKGSGANSPTKSSAPRSKKRKGKRARLSSAGGSRIGR